MNFVIAQILGIIVTGICIIMTHFKKMGAVLVSELAANVLTAIQYSLLGGISGSYLCVVAAIHTLVLSLFNKYCKNNIKIKRYLIFVFFISVYIGIAILKYKCWVDIFSVASSIVFSVAVIQTRPSRYRILNLTKTFLLFFYDLYTYAFTNILTRAFTAVSCITAIWRLDFKSKNL